MVTLISLMQWLITAIGFLSVGIVALRSASKSDSPLVAMLMPIQTVAIKVAGVALVAYVILVTYVFSEGILSIQTIGMYAACFGILYSLFKDMAMKSAVMSDVHAVVTHKAATIQSKLAAQAAEARKAGVAREQKQES